MDFNSDGSREMLVIRAEREISVQRKMFLDDNGSSGAAAMGMIIPWLWSE
jgi:hypothetical protein